MVTWKNSPDQSTPLSAENLQAAFDETKDASQLTTGTVADARLPVTAQAATLSDTYAPLSPSTLDGHNVKNLRRPTLVVDRMFPNARQDHTVVWASETDGRIYSISQDKRLRLATWNPALGSEDIGSFPTLPRASATATQTWAMHGLFIRTASGALLMEQYDSSTGLQTLRRSTSASDGVVWETVWTAADDVLLLGPTSVSQDPLTGYLYLTEYSSGSTLTHIDILRSTDDGVTWSVFKSMPKSPGGAGAIRHWHGARYDTVSQRMHFMAGDQNDIAGIYRVNAAGDDVEPVILNSQIDPTMPYARCVDVMFFPDYIVWGNDGTGGQNYIYRMNRDQIGVTSPVVERIATINNTAWYAHPVRADGSMWLCSASSEIGGSTPVGDTSLSHLYVVTNNGATVDDVASVSMEGIYGAASLTGIPGATGNDAFWLRVHGYQQYPLKSSSAFQFRARISYGTSTLVKPTGNRTLIYSPESRNWMGDLTASETKTFGHSKSRMGLTKLTILNMGVWTLTGIANKVKLQVFNLSAGTVIHELPLGYADWRTDFLADTQEFAYQYTVAANQVIVFRLVETNGTTATVSAFIEFGWSI